MRNYLLLCFFLSRFCHRAQERFIDNTFEVHEVNTRTYAVKDGEELTLDIYEPQNDKARERPALIFMHGGGFAGGSPKNESEVKLAEMAAARGYVAVQISYRLTRKDKSFGCDYESSGKMETFRSAAEDFIDAVKYVHEHREELRIDPEKFIVGGSSAGAEAVLNAVYNPGLMFDDPSIYGEI